MSPFSTPFRILNAALALALLGMGGCGEAPGIFVQGQVLGGAGGAKAGEPVPGLRVHYQLALTIADGTEQSLDFWQVTDEHGQFFIDQGGIEGIQDRITKSRARVTLLATLETDADWAAASEVEPPQQGGSGAPLTRNDRFTLTQPLISAGVSVVAMKETSAGPATTTQEKANAWVNAASAIWNQCGIALVPMTFREGDASAASVMFHPNALYELDKIRQAFTDPKLLTMIVSGDWDRGPRSDFRGDDSWAYSAYPKAPYQGTVAEPRAVDRPAILAHETGHSFSLLHVDDPTVDYVDDTTVETVGANSEAGDNLMFHVVYEKNTVLTPGQCARARASIAQYRPNLCHPWEGTGCATP